MHLLYSDESGTIDNSKQKYFILAGVSVFERKTHWVGDSLNKIAARFETSDPQSVELHGSPMVSGRGRWRGVPKQARIDAVCDALNDGILGQNRRSIRLFGVVLEKANYSGRDILGTAFEQLASRFDAFLRRLHRRDDTQRGLIVFDKSKSELFIQSLAHQFKDSGHSYGRLCNYAEVPVFLDSKASRLIQLADLVAYALFRNYEKNDATFYDIIKNCFDAEGGVQHGLYVA